MAKEIQRENVNTSPEPREKAKLPKAVVPMPKPNRSEHMSNAFQNNKDNAFQAGFFEPGE